MAFDFIKNYIYLYHTDEFVILPSYPESITDSMSSSFAQANALSRSAPVFSYSNSGPRTVQVTLDLHRDMMDDVNIGYSNLKINDATGTAVKGGNLGDDYVDVLIKKLQSISVPRYMADSSKTVEPPMIAVRFGDEIFIKGIVNGPIGVTYKKPIIMVNGHESKYAQVSISFTVTEVDPYDAPTIGLKGSFRGLVSTNNILKNTRDGKDAR